MKLGCAFSTRRNVLLLAAVLVVVAAPQAAHAYAGPGAGFAVLSSFWTLFVAFLYSLYALLTWPLITLAAGLLRVNL